MQGWFGKGFVGGGIGLGVAIGCADTCDASSTSGFDLRAGCRVDGAATVSFEVESLDGFFSQQVADAGVRTARLPEFLVQRGGDADERDQ